MTQAFPHDGLLGGLNLLKRTDCQQLLNPGDRPPYPIIIHCPTLRQIVENMNRADIAIFVFYTMIGVDLIMNLFILIFF